MNVLKEESFVIDYLKSFELINMKSDMEETNSILDRVIDSQYKKKIQQYVDDINRGFHDSVIRYFIGNQFNILFSIVNDNNIDTFENLLTALNKYTLDDLFGILRIVFNLSPEVNLQNIEKMALSFEDKWKLAMLINEFSSIKVKLLLELPIYYEKYLEYAEEIYRDYLVEIKQVEDLLADGEFLYKNIFSKYIDRKIFNGIDRRLILLLSTNEVIVYSTSRSQLIAIGLYVVDFYLEVERQKKVDEIKMTQIFKALADPTRYEILKSLNKGITSNSVLADMLSVSRAAISMQFKHLQANEIIIVDEVTKQYTVNTDIIKYAIEKVQLDMDLLSE